MEKIFNQAKDKNVAAVKLYKKAADANYVYTTSTAADTDKISAAALEDAFLKGCVIVDGTNTYVPVKLAVADGVATIMYVTADATTATTAVLATLNSEEYVSEEPTE